MKQYRPNAGIIVFRRDGKVLLCERIENFPKRWQFPQGGLESGETPLQAAIRELKEDTSITSVKFISAYPEPLFYEFPQEIKQSFARNNILTDGQKQYWHLFLFEGQENEINLQTQEPEFRAYKWINIEETTNMVVEFKKQIYEIIVPAFRQIIETYLKKL